MWLMLPVSNLYTIRCHYFCKGKRQQKQNAAITGIRLERALIDSQLYYQFNSYVGKCYDCLFAMTTMTVY